MNIIHLRYQKIDRLRLAKIILSVMIKISLPIVITSSLRKYIRLVTEKQNKFYLEQGRNNMKEFVELTPDWVYPFLISGQCGYD